MPTGPPDAAQWRIAIRFLTFGIMVAGLVAVMWTQSRLANRLDNQIQLLLKIQADVLVTNGQIATVLNAAEQISHRMVSVEERASAASEDRRQMRATDAQLTEALIRLRALLDALHDPQSLHNLPDEETEPGPKTRPRPQRE